MAVSKRKGIIAVIIMFLTLILFALHITFNVNPVIEQVSEKEVVALAEVAVNSACNGIISDMISDKIVDYVMDNDGNLQMVITNTAQMNLISRKAIEASQQNIERLGEQGIPIPLGSLSGITLLSGQGPDVYIKVFPIGSVTAEFVSEFIAAGINQTRHKIILNINANIKVVMPGAGDVVQTNTEILMCENLIIGKVPDAYFNTQKVSDLLDLVP